MRTRKRIRIFLTILLISCTLIVTNSFYQMTFGQGFIFEHIFDGRVSSSFRNANDFGAYLIMLIPMLFSLSCFSFCRKKTEKINQPAILIPRIRILCAVLFIFSLISLGLTFSRGAWVGFIFSIIVFGLSNRKGFLIYGLAIIIFLMMFYPKLMEERSPITSKKTFFEQNNRLNYWKRASGIIKDYPYFGSGVNTYALVAGRYSVGWGGYPHNSYLQMAAETGPIGLLAFLWMLIVLFLESFKSYQKIKIQEERLLLLGVQTGLLGFLIHSFFDTNLYSVQLGSLMWVMMGLIVAIQIIDRPSNIA